MNIDINYFITYFKDNEAFIKQFTYLITIQLILITFYRFFNQISNESYIKNKDLRLPSSILDYCVKLFMLTFMFLVICAIYENPYPYETSTNDLIINFYKRVMILVVLISILLLDYYPWFVLAPLLFENIYFNSLLNGYVNLSSYFWLNLCIKYLYRSLILVMMYGLTLKPYFNFKMYRILFYNALILICINIALEFMK